MRSAYSTLPQNNGAVSSMDTRSRFGLVKNYQALSDTVASELVRRGHNCGDPSVAASLDFIAGRLPAGITTGRQLSKAVEDALLMSSEDEIDIVDQVLGAFGVARREM